MLQVVWLAIVMQAFGGVVVALVVQFADNIAKNFATSISIVISFLASVVFFDFEITTSFLAGTIVVLGATYLYNTTPKPVKPRLPPINVTNFEKGGEPAYFDIETAPGAAKTPLRHDALSTSRPSTPIAERQRAPKSPAVGTAKRFG